MSTSLVVASVPVVLVVVLGPGLLVGRLLGLRGLALAGVAAALSCTLLGVGGALAQLVGVRWSPWLYLLLTAAVAVVAWLVGRSLAPVDREPEARGLALAALAGGGLGSATVLAGFLASMGSVRQVPAQPDATYHLNAIRAMLDSGDVSSRDGGSFLYGRAHSFYPSTFHGLAATAGEVVSAQPVVLANLLALVAAAVVWVAGCLLLTRQALGCRPRAVLFGGIAAGSFGALPYWVGGYGVLWPYLLALALVPGLLACVLSLVGLAQADLVGRTRAAVAGLVGLAGLGLVHPHAVAALALVSYPMLVVAALGRLARRRTRASALLALAAVLGPLVLWWAAAQTPQIRSMSRTYRLGPEDTLSQAVVEALTNAPKHATPLWCTSVVVVVGVAAGLRRPATRWLPVAWVLVTALLVAVAGVQSGLTRALTVYWYNGIPRVAAVVPLVAVPAVAAGLDAVSGWLVARGRGGTGAGGGSPATVAGAVAVAYLVLTLGNNHAAHVDLLRPYWRPTDPTTELLSRPDAAALQRLAASIPPDALVADNPWRGHALLYAFTGRRVLFASEKAATTADRTLVADQLDQAGSAGGAEVCAAVRRLGVSYVVTGGSNDLGHHNGRSDFAGVDGVPGQPGFVPVATVAPYTLWRVTACGP